MAFKKQRETSNAYNSDHNPSIFITGPEIPLSHEDNDVAIEIAVGLQKGNNES